MDVATSVGLTLINRDGDGNPLLEDGESILHTFPDVQLILSSSSDQGVGKLCITEGRVVWTSDNAAASSYAADFSSISMHAVATDPESVDKPCLYVQLDTDFQQEHDQDEDDNDNEDEKNVVPELRLIPADADALDDIFLAFCEGAERNPDEDAAEEAQGTLFYDQGEALANIMIDMDDGDDRFEEEDDEEEEEEEEEK